MNCPCENIVKTTARRVGAGCAECVCQISTVIRQTEKEEQIKTAILQILLKLTKESQPIRMEFV